MSSLDAVDAINAELDALESSRPPISVAVSTSAPVRSKMYDLLITGGRVIDPANGTHRSMDAPSVIPAGIDDQRDVAIRDGKIAAIVNHGIIRESDAERTFNATGLLVVPGLVPQPRPSAHH